MKKDALVLITMSALLTSFDPLLIFKTGLTPGLGTYEL